MSSNIKKYEFIDAIRGWAILLVVAFHCREYSPYSGYIVKNIANFGVNGVPLFYIASALTLSLSWYSRKSQEYSPVRNFFIRRLFRIAPLFYVAMAIYLLIYGFAPRYFAPNGLQWWFIPLTAVFLNGYAPETINSLVPGEWSIAVEMNFYAVLPVIFRFVRSLGAAIALFLVSLALSWVMRKVFHGIYDTRYPTTQAYLVTDFCGNEFFNQLPIFALGIIVFFLRESDQYQKFSGSNLVKWIFLLTYGAALPIFIAIFSGKYSIVDHEIVAAVIFAPGVLFLGAFPSKLFVNPITTSVGKVSFSMYLFHLAIVEMLERVGIKQLIGTGGWAFIEYFALICVGAYGLSYALRALIEEPGISIGKRIINRLEARSGSTVARPFAPVEKPELP